jgi:tRNA nucleotidyltransferase (CCA-adding enzyme)
MQDLSPSHAHVSRTIASRLATLGHRAWIVGGAVRDLALGRTPTDVDMTSSAPPSDVERLFDRTAPVGRAFGTVLILLEGLDVEHTTFRTDSTYSDARRPDTVRFGTSLEEDAQRRDFTCNALYLDPLTGAVSDPTGGRSDLEHRLLRCVGDPLARFREDGLRLVRMARFAAALDLTPEPATLAAAAAAADALKGVSPERILVELETIFARPRSTAALALLDRAQLLARVLPGLEHRLLEPPSAWWRARAPVLAALPDPPGLALGLAALHGPAPDATHAFAGTRADSALELLDALRVSRATRQRVASIWSVAGEVDAAGDDPGSRARRIRWMRAEGFAEALSLVRAWRRARGSSAAICAALAEESARLGPDALAPAPLLTARDLETAGVPRGPAWGTLLREAETLQLDHAHVHRDDALRWLATRARELAHDGGNTRRNAKDNG